VAAVARLRVEQGPVEAVPAEQVLEEQILAVRTPEAREVEHQVEAVVVPVPALQRMSMPESVPTQEAWSATDSIPLLERLPRYQGHRLYLRAQEHSELWLPGTVRFTSEAVQATLPQ
jgi:hypothetical protein